MRWAQAGSAGLLAVAALLAGCGERGEQGHDHAHDDHGHDHAHDGASAAALQGEPKLVATIWPLASLAKQIVGDTGTVEVLLGAGVTEHADSLTPDRLRLVNDTGVLLSVGMGLDPVARTAQNAAREVRTVVFADLVGKGGDASHDHGHAHGHDHDVPAKPQAAEDAHDHHGHHHHDHSGPNPHLWLDPLTTVDYVKALAAQLGQLYPAHAETFTKNAAALVAEIEAIDKEYAPKLAALPKKQLVTFHNAFDPLAEHYGLEVVAHLTEIELSVGGEVSPRQLAQAIEAIRTHDLKVIYAEPQFPDVAVRALQGETGVQVLILDPLGAATTPGYETYQAALRSNLDTLIKGQSLP